MRQLGNRIEFDSLILACDVGGTNTGIAVVGRLGRRFDILQRYRYSSQALSSMQEAVERTLAVLAETTPHLRPRLICISGAGPVRDNYCE
ncbi:MAG: glucokinase, partial [Spirochaetales bacterium]|nr:glucokinase [Spirochaetales bacterium]